MLCSCQNLAVDFSPVKNVFQVKLVHENASSFSLTKGEKKTYLLGGLFLLVICVLFFGLCNIEPEALQGLLSAGSWYLLPVPAAPSTSKFSEALALQPRRF